MNSEVCVMFKNKHFLVHPANIAVVTVVTFAIFQHWIPAVVISVIYFSERNRTIKSPDFAIIHLFEKAIKKVGPGLCVLFPGVSLDERTGKEFEVLFGDENVLSGEKNIGIGMTGNIWLRANQKAEDSNSLDKLLKLPEDEAIAKASQAANNALEEYVASQVLVIDIQKHKQRAIKAIREAVIKAMGGEVDGGGNQTGGAYIVESVQLSDMDASALTEAARIERVGEASAKAAKSLRNALGKKHAYIPQAVAEGGRAAEAATKNIAAAMASNKESSTAISELNDTMKDVVKKLDKVRGD